jgi:ribosomal protein S12 methylthiotransferase accessory factor
VADEQNRLVARFERAASALAADAGLVGLPPQETSLLRSIGYDDGDAAKAEGRARMLRAAAKFRRIFPLPVPDAPGIVFFGGEADPAILDARHAGSQIGNLAGSGLTPQRAFEACVGEGIEYLSQFAREGDPVECGSFADYGDLHDADARRFVSQVLEAGGIDTGRAVAWIRARRLLDGAKAWFPVDLCCRRPIAERDFAPPLKLSTGCAAGPTVEAATLRAALELIERDAVALWWRGGGRGRAIAPDSEAGRAAGELLAKARQGNAERRSWLLDITTDVEIPAVAALSAHLDGYGFAFGFAARLTLAEAASAALFELFQVELGQHVVAAKRRESGDDALNESDRRQLRRGTLFDARHCALLRPDGDSRSVAPGIPDDPASGLQHVLGRLGARGVTAYALDLTRSELGVPAVRVLAPGLQLEPCQIMGPRLAGMIRETGGGALHTGGMALL